ncbi:hypothetical protein L1887_18323 [Cichorium endivia]|nr:hypothetical protein L1887_18323 [Cichorium endivia]
MYRRGWIWCCVQKGELSEQWGNRTAAIKRLSRDSYQGERENQQDTELYTKVAGTQFYLDPSYHESGILRKESDVYSFGVVLFEILSGMLVYRERSIGDERQFLMNSVRRYHLKDTYKIIDPHIIDEINGSSFHIFKEIAYQCISFNLAERPTFDTVIEKIEVALNIQPSPTLHHPSRSTLQENTSPAATIPLTAPAAGVGPKEVVFPSLFRNSTELVFFLIDLQSPSS